MKSWMRLLAATTLVAVAAVVVGQQVGRRFCLRGRFVTDDVIVREGELYVPVSAVARSLGLRVRQLGLTCDLVPEEATAGYRFEVLDVVRTSSYRARLGFHDASVDARPGRELIVVTCRLWNATGQPQSIDLYGGRDTRLIDAELRSSVPTNGAVGLGFNGRAAMFANTSVDFALKFDVPKGFRLNRLTFSVQNSFDQTPIDFRVSLRSP